MPEEKLNILIVDDDTGERKHIMKAIRHAEMPWNCTEAASMGDALAACGETAFDCVRAGNMADACSAHSKRDAFDCAIVDYNLPAQDGLTGVSALRQRFPCMAILVATGQGNEMIATEAMKRGASDYIRKKDLTAGSIRHKIETAVERELLLRAVAELSAGSEDEFL